LTSVDAICPESAEDRLERALRLAGTYGSPEQMIGVMKEKTLHSVLKFFVDPDPGHHEIKVGPYFADVISGGRIYEIQTGSLSALRKKIAFFLSSGIPVTVVKPVPAEKRLAWVSDTGEVSNPRKTRGQTVSSVLPEVYYIKEFTDDPGFSLNVLSLRVCEYRLLDGWSRDKKKGSHRDNRVPEEIIGSIDLKDKAEYNKLIPYPLPEKFTSEEFGKAARLQGRKLSFSLVTLRDLGLIRVCEKKGNKNVYEIVSENP